MPRCSAGTDLRAEPVEERAERADAERRVAQPLREAAHEPDGGRRAERGQKVMVDTIPEAGVADLVQALELVERHRASVGHQQTVECDS